MCVKDYFYSSEMICFLMWIYKSVYFIYYGIVFKVIFFEVVE